MNETTKSFLSGKKKFGAVTIAILVNGVNDVFGLGLSQQTLEIATYMGGGYAAIEAILDLVRALSAHFLAKKQVEVEQEVAVSDEPVHPMDAH